jgi:hypothetical protein
MASVGAEEGQAGQRRRLRRFRHVSGKDEVVFVGSRGLSSHLVGEGAVGGVELPLAEEGATESPGTARKIVVSKARMRRRSRVAMAAP